VASSIEYLDLYLYNSAQAQIGLGFSAAPGATVSFQIALTSGQVYYLKADGYSGTGAYTVTLYAVWK